MSNSFSLCLGSVLSLLLLTGCGGSGSSGETTHSNILTLTTDNFQAQVLASSKPVLIDFWAEWCAPCKRIAPMVADIAVEYEGRAVVGKVDFDQNKELALRYQIESLPTLMVFKDGKEFARIIGAQGKEAITAKLDAALATK